MQFTNILFVSLILHVWIYRISGQVLMLRWECEDFDNATLLDLNYTVERRFPGRRLDTAYFSYQERIFLFGGDVEGFRNDIWEDTRSGTWEWKAGTSIPNATGVFGEIGNGTNTTFPGARVGATVQVVGQVVYIFAGYGYNAEGNLILLNDLWAVNMSDFRFTWISGGNGTSSQGKNLGKSEYADDVQPRGRTLHAMTSIGAVLYVFGGFTLIGNSNEIFAFNTTKKQWAWLNGNFTTRPGNYRSDPNERYPPSRCGASLVAFQGNLYIFGGNQRRSKAYDYHFNDIWLYNLSSHLWIWEQGTSSAEHFGTYGTEFVFDGSMPSARTDHIGVRYKSAILIHGGRDSIGYLSDSWLYYMNLKQFMWIGGSSEAYYEKDPPGNSYSRGVWKKSVFLTNNTLFSYGRMYYDEAFQDNECRMLLAANTSEDENLCSAGKYVWNSTCLYCSTGRFSYESMLSSCEACPVGTDSHRGESACRECFPGKYSAGRAVACHECSLGRYSDLNGFSNCKNCSDGYGRRIGSSSCVECFAGKYGKAGEGCHHCGFFMISNSSGSSTCDLCPEKRKCSFGLSFCRECPKYLAWSWSSDGGPSEPNYTLGNAHPGERYPGHGAFMYDQKFFLFGGHRGNFMNDIWEFDLEKWSWRGGSSLFGSAGFYGKKGQGTRDTVPSSRRQSATAVIGHVAYIFGGNSKLGRFPVYLNDLWAFDILTQKFTWISGYREKEWSKGRGLPGSRGSHAMTAVGDSLYVFGGQNKYSVVSNEIFKYDTLRKHWSKLSGDWDKKANYTKLNESPGARSGTSLVVWRDCLWIFGGFGFTNAIRQGYLNDIWSFNLSISSWSWEGGTSSVFDAGKYGSKLEFDNSRPSSRMGHSAVVYKQGMLIFAGSDTSYFLMNDLWIYYFQKKTFVWIDGSAGGNVKSEYGANSYPGGRMSHVMYTIGNTLVVYGYSHLDAVNHTTDVWMFGLAIDQTEEQTSCGSGKYISEDVCVFCPLGRYSEAGASVCMTCSTTGNATSGIPLCAKCPKGKYSFSGFEINEDCTECQSGKFTNKAASTSCKQCPDGFGSPPGSTHCTECPVGKFSKGGGTCLLCSPVTFSNKSGSSSCEMCSLQCSYGLSHCFDCPEYLTWNWKGEQRENHPVSYKSENGDPGSRYGAASLLYENRIIIFGGCSVTFPGTSKNIPRNDYWEFDMEKWFWIGGTVRAGARAVYGELGKGTLSTFPGGRRDSAMVNIGPVAYIYAGWGYNDTSAGLLNDIWSFDMRSGIFTWIHGFSSVNSGESGNLPQSRYGHVMIAHDDKFYIFGGRAFFTTGDTYSNAMFEFDLRLQKWTRQVGFDHTYNYADYGSVQIPGGRTESSMIAFNDFFCLFGGFGYDGYKILGHLNDLWIYNISGKTWRWHHGFSSRDHQGVYGSNFALDGSVPSSRSRHAAVVYKSAMLIFGGFTGNKRLNDLWIYYFNLNKFSRISGDNKETSQPGVRHSLNMHVVSNTLVLFGGDTLISNRTAPLWTFLLAFDILEKPYECGAGKFVFGSDCLYCPQGRFSNSSGASSCEICPYRFGSDGGASSCNICLPGKFSNKDRICQNCKFGDYNPFKGSTVCFPCAAGYASKPGVSRCEICAVGRFNSPERQLVDADGKLCVGCLAGKYSDAPGASACVNCAIGYGSLSRESMCRICAPGNFSTQQSICTTCREGKHSSVAGTTVCMDCPSGYGSNKGASACHICKLGKFSSLDRLCLSCGKGRYTPSDGMSTCINCAIGYGSNFGSSVCSECSRGEYAGQFMRCTSCKIGRYSLSPRSSTCTKCAVGHVSGNRASVCSVCMPGMEKQNDQYCGFCEPGKYSSMPAQTTCQFCGEGAWSHVQGSTKCQTCSGLFPEPYPNRYGPSDVSDLAECYCNEGFYGQPFRGHLCLPCHENTKCPQNTTLPIIMPGYTRSHNDRNVAIECFPPEACLGGSGLEIPCKDGYTGDFCSDCVAIEYFRKNEKCHVCSKWSQVNFVLYLLAILVFLYVVLDNSTPDKKKAHVFSIVLFWLQIMDVIASTVDEWPETIRWVFDLCSMLNLNLDLFEPECSFGVNYWMKWHLKMTAALLLGAMQLYFFVLQEVKIRKSYIFEKHYPKRIFLFFKTNGIKSFYIATILVVTSIISALRRLKNKFIKSDKTRAETEENIFDKDDLYEKYVYRTSRFVYAYSYLVGGLYILIAKTSFEMFRCTEYQDGTFVMANHIAQQCYDGYWWQMLVTNIIFSSHWLLGVPLYVWYLLVFRKDDMNEQDFSKNYAPFTVFYCKERSLWPVVEILLKLVVVVSTHLVVFYSPLPGYFAVGVSISLYAIVLIYLKPYVSKVSHWISFAYVRTVALG